MTRIKMSRLRGWYGAVRDLKIVADGKTLGGIRQNETKDFEIPHGATEIWGKMDWGKTRKVPVSELSDGDEVVFQSYFSFNPLKLFAISQLPFRVSVTKR